MTTQAGGRQWWLWPLVIVLLPFALVTLVLWLTTSLLLLVVVWLTWCARGRYALVVYSDSPIWKQYFETRVLPYLAGRAAVLNWSERRTWTISLAVLLFRAFAGRREYNPIAIVFAPLSLPRRFRFYPAFRSFKQGRADDVEAMRAEFIRLLDELARPASE